MSAPDPNSTDPVSIRDASPPAGNEIVDYVPSPDVAPAQAASRQQTTARTSFSARTMSALTSETARNRRRQVPSARLVAKILLLLDLAAFGALIPASAAISGVTTAAWSVPVDPLLVLGVLLMGTLGLIDAYRINLRERFWRMQGSILVAIGTTTGLALGASFAVGFWEPDGIAAVLHDRVLVVAAGFALLTVVNRSLLHRWMRRASVGASWLLVARRDTEGLERFWADFRAHSHGRLMFLADRPPTHQRSTLGAPAAPTLPVNGEWHDLRAQLAKPWSGIIVVDASLLDPDTARAVMEARLSGTPVLSLEEFYEYNWRRVPVFLLRSEWFALSRGFEILRSPVQTHLKRAVDMLLAGGLLVLALPLILGIAIGVKLDSPGPILYRQPRTGRGGRVFTCLKFRSMVTGADRGSLYAGKNDQRVTRFGRFIRRARIDELPQLINVLKGDMSFIGPRAMWTQIVAGHEQEIPYFQLRHLVRPGLTGWAQVNYHYGGSADDMRIKLEYDLWYIKNQSLFLDLWIVVRTVRVVLFGIGAQ